MAWLLFIGGASKVGMQQDQEEEEEDDAGSRSQLVRCGSTLEMQDASRVSKNCGNLARQACSSHRVILSKPGAWNLFALLTKMRSFMILEITCWQNCKSLPNILVNELESTLFSRISRPWTRLYFPNFGRICHKSKRLFQVNAPSWPWQWKQKR